MITDKRKEIFSVVLYTFIFFIFCYTVSLSSELKLSGAIRNDAFFLKIDDNYQFSDILENRLILTRDEEKWKFYGDARLFLLYGEIADSDDAYEFKLMRSFIRYFTELGDFTLGKTYINLGNSGIFNPFEIDKNLLVSDINYAKEGLLALEIDLLLGDLSGLKLFIGYDDQIANYTSGLNIVANFSGFDLGIVTTRKGEYRAKKESVALFTDRLIEDENSTGFYFKGDLIVGLEGAYCFHFDDRLERSYNETNLGLDYSFFDSKFIIKTILYYNQNGADSIRDYVPLYDAYFYAKYYMFWSIDYIFDEFFSIQALSFSNLVDGSAMIIPSATTVLANGLTFTVQFVFLTGKGDEEFSRNINGDYSILARVQGKF